jgi:hypothetical protein
MMKLMRGKFSGLDGTARLWPTAGGKTNQLCAPGFSRFIAMSQIMV